MNNNITFNADILYMYIYIVIIQLCYNMKLHSIELYSNINLTYYILFIYKLNSHSAINITYFRVTTIMYIIQYNYQGQFLHKKRTNDRSETQSYAV